MNAYLRVVELQRRAQEAATRKEAQAILAEATLLQTLDRKLRS